MHLIEILFLAAALGVDCLVVSFSQGLVFTRNRTKNSLALALTMGFSQGIMPCAGYFFTGAISRYIEPYAKWLVFIIFFILPRIHADFQHGIVNDFANSRTVRAFTDSNEKVHFLEKKDAHENHQQHYREAG